MGEWRLNVSPAHLTVMSVMEFATYSSHTCSTRLRAWDGSTGRSFDLGRVGKKLSIVFACCMFCAVCRLFTKLDSSACSVVSSVNYNQRQIIECSCCVVMKGFGARSFEGYCCCTTCSS